MAVVKKKVLSFSHVITNQAKGSYIVRRIKLLLDHLVKVTWCIGFIHTYGIGPSHTLKMAMLKMKINNGHVGTLS
jgi:hypothetical protein